MAKNKYLRPGPMVLGIVITLVVVAALYLAIRKPPYQVDLAEVTRGPMTVTIDDEGETRAHDLYVVAAPINGRLTRIELEAGDPVVAGRTVVARITPLDPDFLDQRIETRVRAQVQALEAMYASSSMRVEQARAAHDLAVQDQRRLAALFKRGFATRAALDRANASVSANSAAYSEAVRATQAARFEREAARANLVTPGGQRKGGRALEVRSPVSGAVMRLPRESEAPVAAGTPLVEIGDPRNLEIVTDLLSADAVKLQPRGRVLIENWGGAKPLNGRIQRIEPYGFTKISALGVEEQRVNVIIDITDPPALWTRLGHGYRVIVRVVEWESNDALMLPVSALFRDKGQWAVFVVEQGRARLAKVKIGRMNDETTEVLSGIAQGSRIILHPSEKIETGARVTPR
jgi:HlyD family secretion protein